MLPLLLIALQAVPAAPSPGNARVSILLPDCPASEAAKQPASKEAKQPASEEAKQDVVVCGRRPGSDRAPELRGGPSLGPMPSNPAMTGVGALRAEGTPCAASQWGCSAPVNLVAPALMLANEVRLGLGTLFDKARDKSKRVPIALDGPEPQGHLEP